MSCNCSTSFRHELFNETRFGINRVPYKHPTIGTVPVSISTPSYMGLTSNALDEEVGTTFSYIDNVTMTRGRAHFQSRRRYPTHSAQQLRATPSTTQPRAMRHSPDFIQNKIDSISDNAAEGIHGLRRTFYMGMARTNTKSRRISH